VDEALEAGSLCHIFSYLYLLESLYDGFYLVDSDLRFVVWNGGAENLLGHSHRKMLDQVWSSREFEYARCDDDSRSEHDSPLHEVIATGKPAISHVRMRHADRSWKDVELQTVPLLDAAHRLQGVAEIFRDLSGITKRQPAQVRLLQMAASRDSLTSVANRGELEMQLQNLFAEYAARNRAEPFSVIFLDVDFFKSVNDRFGHAVGDEVLVEVARMLEEETYSGELVARYGGEEFVVLCPGTTLEHAANRAERLRVAMPRIRIAELEGFLLTASFGVTQVEPEDNPESILRRADKALYQAKEAGRNQTISLTSAQLRAVTQATAQESGQSFVFQGAFQAYIASDMIIYKLGGFVTDHHAALTEVTPKRIVFRMGKLGLFSSWGKSDRRRPVQVELSFGEAEQPIANRKFNGGRIRLAVKITPVGKVKDATVFQERAGRANRELRAYFVGEAE
jgi:diguanylate cyclase (GGDEF)-like protein/PAS domain S-box-containing protein